MNVHVKLTTATPPMQPVLTHLDHSPVNVWQASMETVLLAPVSEILFPFGRYICTPFFFIIE